MAYLTEQVLHQPGYKKLGSSVKSNDCACVFSAELTERVVHSCVDDFCALSDKLVIGQYTPLTPMCLCGGDTGGVYVDGACALISQLGVIAQPEGSRGESLGNMLIPETLKIALFSAVSLGRQVTESAREKWAIGTMALVIKSTVAGETQASRQNV